MMDVIDEQSISQIGMDEAKALFKKLNACIEILESTEPPSHDRDDHYYWYREFSDIWHDTKLVEMRILALLDEELNNYFKQDPIHSWSKENACKLLNLQLDRDDIIQ